MSDALPFDAISLDVDGTLYDLGRMKWRVALKMPGQLGFLNEFRSVREQLRDRGEPVADFRATQCDLLARRRNADPDKTAARIEKVIYEQLPAIYRKAKPYEGVREALEQLVARGITLAILSDYPSQDKLDGLGLGDLPFAAVHSGEDAGALKPHPASFERLAQTLGLAPGRILHLGDREDCDVQGALAAGFLAGRFAPKGGQSAARLMFSKWSQLHDRIARIFG